MVHHPTIKEENIQKVIGVLIRNTVIEVLEAPQGQGAGLLGADLILGHTQDRVVEPVHTHGLGLHLLGLVHGVSTVIVLGAVGHLPTLL